MQGSKMAIQEVFKILYHLADQIRRFGQSTFDLAYPSETNAGFRNLRFANGHR